LAAAQLKFDEFKLRFNKRYVPVEEEHVRFEIFRDNMDRAAALQSADPEATFGVTKFSDLTATEFRDQFLNFRPVTGEEAAQRLNWPVSRTPWSNRNDGFDWRTHGAITDVKDQGQCGSCWAFSAVEEMESMWFLANHSLTELSPQQVVSCDKGAGDLGCNGGDTVVAYKYMGKAGLQSETSYPYTSGDTGVDGRCTYDASKVVARMVNWTYSTPPCMDSCTHQDENTLQANLEKIGPVSVCVAADSWQSYSGGILSANCPKSYSALDHCVQLVGWSTSGATKYWMLRNSWANDWGIDGYIHIKFGSNLCGLADEATHIHC
jgi:C1A family cysteine protease